MVLSPAAMIAESPKADRSMRLKVGGVGVVELGGTRR